MPFVYLVLSDYSNTHHVHYVGFTLENFDPRIVRDYHGAYFPTGWFYDSHKVHQETYSNDSVFQFSVIKYNMVDSNGTNNEEPYKKCGQIIFMNRSYDKLQKFWLRYSSMVLSRKVNPDTYGVIKEYVG